jgi:hypothetical protein
MCIITGPRVELAITLVDRMKKLFEPASVYFDSKETVIELNGVRIEAFPSHHLDAARGLANVSFILLDESDFFPIGQQQDARDVSERYIAKSDPYIVMVSTPNQPGGLFETIEREHSDKCLYKRIFLDYTYGLGKIYSYKDIEVAKTSPSFSREFNLMYGGHIGNVFSENSIQVALKMGAEQYDPTSSKNSAVNPFAKKVMAIDPGWGSSACGYCICQLVNVMTTTIRNNSNSTTMTYSAGGSYTGDVIQILYAEEFSRPDFNDMISLSLALMQRYGLSNDPDARVFVDGSASAFIRSLKTAIGENPDYEGVIARAKSAGFKEPPAHWLGKVSPIMFGTGGAHKSMLGHAKMLLDNHYIAIHPSFTKLVTAIRTAYENDGSLDKERTAHNDVFDAWRMCLKHFELKSRR